MSDVQMLRDALSTSLLLERLGAMTSSQVALAAPLLASLGVYGVLASLAAERTRDIGTRTALGARASAVVRMVMARGLRLIAYGGVLGLAGGPGVSRLIRNLLYGVTATEPDVCRPRRGGRHRRSPGRDRTGAPGSPGSIR